MKCTFWIISCPVIRSNIYRKKRSHFQFRKSTRRFSYKLVHGVFCPVLTKEATSCKRRSNCFCADVLYVENSARSNNIPREYINNREWPINTNYCLFFANKQLLQLRTSASPRRARLRIERLFDQSNASRQFW